MMFVGYCKASAKMENICMYACVHVGTCTYVRMLYILYIRIYHIRYCCRSDACVFSLYIALAVMQD